MLHHLNYIANPKTILILHYLVENIVATNVHRDIIIIIFIKTKQEKKMKLKLLPKYQGIHKSQNFISSYEYELSDQHKRTINRIFFYFCISKKLLSSFFAVSLTNHRGECFISNNISPAICLSVVESLLLSEIRVHIFFLMLISVLRSPDNTRNNMSRGFLFFKEKDG